jgi:hypothetical protein
MSRLRGLLVVLISVWLALLVDGAAMVTSERVASMWRRVGGTRSSCATAVAVAMAESSFNCEAYNVNPATKSRECAYDCACNVREAHRISRKGSNWTPWTSFKHNRHSPYLPMATEVCARVYASEGL